MRPLTKLERIKKLEETKARFVEQQNKMKDHIKFVKNNPPLDEEKVMKAGVKVSRELQKLARVFADMSDPYNSHSRAEMMKCIGDQFGRIERKVSGWISKVDTALDGMSKDKNAVILENHRFKKKMQDIHDNFVKDTQQELYDKGFNLQQIL